MGKGIVKVGKTFEGKYFGQVKTVNGEFHETTHYETPEYVTEEMALADAKCWKEFHMTDKPECDHRFTYYFTPGKVGDYCRLCGVAKPVETPKAPETPETPAREYSIYEDDKVYEFGALQNTSKVLDFIGKTLNEKPRTEIKYSELRGMLTEYEGFVLHICVGQPMSNMRGNWRTFTVLKASQK
jgi:hypothetical protein